MNSSQRFTGKWLGSWQLIDLETDIAYEVWIVDYTRQRTFIKMARQVGISEVQAVEYAKAAYDRIWGW